jgi:hypothetical protein
MDGQESEAPATVGGYECVAIQRVGPRDLRARLDSVMRSIYPSEEHGNRILCVPKV